MLPSNLLSAFLQTNCKFFQCIDSELFATYTDLSITQSFNLLPSGVEDALKNDTKCVF